MLLMRIASTLLLLLAALQPVSAQWLPPLASSRVDANGNPAPSNVFGIAPGPYLVTPNSDNVAWLCVYMVNSDGTYTWVPNEPVTLQGWATLRSGWHDHESAISPRPNPTILDPFNTATGADGCARWRITMPLETGWWTFFNLDAGVGAKGYNVYTKVGDSGFLPSVLTPSGKLIDLPFRNAVGLSAVYGPGTRATFPTPDPYDSNHKGQSRFVTPGTGSKVYQAAVAYREAIDYFDSIGAPPVIPILYSDLLTVFRGSLPDGGRADNEYQSMIYSFLRWHSDGVEEHFSGTEVDITNPSIQLGESTRASYLVMAGALEEFGCEVGTTSYDGTLMDHNSAIVYWQNLAEVHFNCGQVTFGNPGGPGPQRGSSNGGRGK